MWASIAALHARGMVSIHKARENGFIPQAPPTAKPVYICTPLNRLFFESGVQLLSEVPRQLATKAHDPPETATESPGRHVTKLCGSQQERYATSLKINLRPRRTWAQYQTIPVGRSRIAEEILSNIDDLRASVGQDCGEASTNTAASRAHESHSFDNTAGFRLLRNSKKDDGSAVLAILSTGSSSLIIIIITIMVVPGSGRPLLTWQTKSR